MKVYIIVQILILYNLHVHAEFDNATIADILSNSNLNIFQIFKKYGYVYERHWVTTEDGYILEIQRIPYGISHKNKTDRPAILLAHGTAGTAAQFINFGHRSMGLVLCDHGYDVWFANARGTKWSRRHKSISPNYKQFWEFSHHEIGVYDFPALIHFIRNKTGQDKIFFAGHSMGGSAFLAMISERPEITEYIRLAFLLSAPSYSQNNKNQIILVSADMQKIIKVILDLIGLYELPYTRIVSEFLKRACHKEHSLFFICTGIVSGLNGFDIEEIDQHLLPTMLSEVPGGMSLQTLYHFAQMLRTGEFRQYDYGMEENLKRYGSVEPPEYQVNRNRCPVAIFYADNDAFVDPKDAELLASKMNNVVLNYKIPYEWFTHIGYFFGTRSFELVYKPMLDLMTKY